MELDIFMKKIIFKINYNTKISKHLTLFSKRIIYKIFSSNNTNNFLLIFSSVNLKKFFHTYLFNDCQKSAKSRKKF